VPACNSTSTPPKSKFLSFRVPELNCRAPLLLPKPTDCPTLTLEVLLDVITSSNVLVDLLICKSAVEMLVPIPTFPVLSTLNA